MKRGGRWTYTVVCVMMAIGRFEMIDWNAPIETVDGVSVKLRWPERVKDDSSSIEVIVSGDDEVSRSYNRDGTHYAGASPKIRNITPTPDERAVAPELVSRLVELAKSVAVGMTSVKLVGKARAIVAALEPVVDEDVLTVRAILHAQQRSMTPPDSGWGNMSYAKGSYDHLPAFKAALAAYRASRTASRDVTPCTREQFEEACRV